LFEMCTPRNQILVKMDEESLILHGVRNMDTLDELEPAPVAQKYGWSLVKSFPFTSIEQVVEESRKIDPIKAEGFVIRDHTWNRLKVKSPAYVALAYLTTTKKSGEIIDKKMTAIVRCNEHKEFLAYYPEQLPKFRYIKLRYDSLCERLQTMFNKAKSSSKNETQYLDALESICKDKKERGLLIDMGEKNVDNVKRFFQDYDLEKLTQMIKWEEIPDTLKINLSKEEIKKEDENSKGKISNNNNGTSASNKKSGDKKEKVKEKPNMKISKAEKDSLSLKANLSKIGTQEWSSDEDDKKKKDSGRRKKK